MITSPLDSKLRGIVHKLPSDSDQELPLVLTVEEGFVHVM